MQRITWLLFVNFETSLQQSYDAENNPHWPRQSTPIDTGSNHNWISSGAQAAFSGAVYSARAGAVAGAMAGTVAGIGAAVILPAYLVAHTIRRALNPPTNYGNRFPNQNQLTSEGSQEHYAGNYQIEHPQGYHQENHSYTGQTGNEIGHYNQNQSIVASGAVGIINEPMMSASEGTDRLQRGKVHIGTQKFNAKMREKSKLILMIKLKKPFPLF